MINDSAAAIVTAGAITFVGHHTASGGNGITCTRIWISPGGGFIGGIVHGLTHGYMIGMIHVVSDIAANEGARNGTDANGKG